jgi:phosphoglycolate phosphatase
MPKQFDLLVFDWDGTLADSTRAIVDAVKSASQDVGMAEPAEEATRGIIGLELRRALQVLFPEAGNEVIQSLAARYHHHYTRFQGNILLFDGALEALQQLTGEGFMLAVASGKGQRGLRHAISSAGMDELILAERSADDCFSKPHPQMLHELMDELGAVSERTVMIGDTVFDLQMAHNAGTASLGVTYGAQPQENLEPLAPLATFDSFAKLHTWLNENA